MNRVYPLLLAAALVLMSSCFTKDETAKDVGRFPGSKEDSSATVNSVDTRLLSIVVSPLSPTGNQNLPLGLTRQYRAHGIYSDNTNQDLTHAVNWSISNSFAAAISNSSNSTGLVTAIGVGTTLITAKLGDISGSTSLTVTDAELLSISITPVIDSKPKGSTQQFTAVGTFSDTIVRNITTLVSWSSSDPSKMSINPSTGYANCLDVGSVTITASHTGLNANANFSVTPAILSSIAVTPTNPNVAKGLTRQFVAMGTYSDSTLEDLTNSVTWQSSLPSIASVNDLSSKGLVTAHGVGTSIITATSGTVSGSSPVSVTPAVLHSIGIAPAPANLPLGLTQRFQATGIFSDASTQDLTTQVTWTSSDPLKASIVPDTGIATSHAVGSTTISASFGSLSQNTTLNVTAAVLTQIAVSPTNRSKPLGLTEQFTAVGTYSNGATADVTNEVTWSVSNPTLANISNASSGLLTTLGVGPLSVMATLGAVSGSTPFEVTSAELVSIAVTPDTSSLLIGLQQQMTATGTYTDGSTVDLTAASTWASSQASFAAIDNSPGNQGKLLGISVGTTTITATFGAIVGSTTVSVELGTLLSINIVPTPSPVSSPVVIPKATPLQMTAMGTYSSGATLNITNQVTWTSSNTNYVTVSNASGSQGLVSWVAFNASGVPVTVNATQGAVTASLPVVPALKVICTELARQGLMPDSILRADMEYGLKYADQEMISNYHAWGGPVAEWMAHSYVLTKVMEPFAKAWAYQMAYKMGAYPEPNRLGTFLEKYGVPVSNYIGRRLRGLK